ncbi:MAG: hypothetical protein GY953_02890, partial [bacterium]|nr:hypothetical protein [bacterium]
WRVRQQTPGGRPRWSRVRSFTIAPGAAEWDRSAFLDEGRWPREHPRLFWNAANWEAIRNLKDTDPLSRSVYDGILSAARKTMRSEWWRQFPADDKKKDPVNQYYQMSKAVLTVALAELLSGDAKYAGHKERMLAMASWPPGGWSSPEGHPPVVNKWSTRLIEMFALYYDWFYHQLTEAERKILENSLDWR